MFPEEQLRISLVEYMVQKLGYPRELISLEKEIALLPHLSHLPKKTIPKRRIDILVFAKGEEGMRPLLMIECKAVALNESHVQQLISYNTFVQAPFIALVNEEEQLFVRAHADLKMKSQFQKGFVCYADLL